MLGRQVAGNDMFDIRLRGEWKHLALLVYIPLLLLLLAMATLLLIEENNEFADFFIFTLTIVGKRENRK